MRRVFHSGCNTQPLGLLEAFNFLFQTVGFVCHNGFKGGTPLGSGATRLAPTTEMEEHIFTTHTSARTASAFRSDPWNHSSTSCCAKSAICTIPYTTRSGTAASGPPSRQSFRTYFRRRHDNSGVSCLKAPMSASHPSLTSMKLPATRTTSREERLSLSKASRNRLLHRSSV